MTGPRTLVIAVCAWLSVAVAAPLVAQQVPAGTPAAPENPYVPPACTGVFTDVACPGGFAVNWIERFYADGITAGCNAAPLQYCPDATVTRAQMAVFVEKAMRGTGSWSPGDLGGGNTGAGAYALLSNDPHALDNTAVGFGALQVQSYAFGGFDTAAANTAVGYYALFSNQPDGSNFGGAGTNNTALGTDALLNNTQGLDNTAVGVAAGASSTVGSYNTFLGVGTDGATGDILDATAIGFNATVDASYHVRIGDAQITQIGGQVGWSNLSDVRAKNGIRDLDLGLDFVMQLRPVSFTMKSGNGRTDMGFVAQDVEALLGDEYNVLGIGGDKDRTLSLRYTDLIAPLVRAVQEQQATIAAQQAEIQALKTQVADRDGQRSQIEALLARVARLEAVRP